MKIARNKLKQIIREELFREQIRLLTEAESIEIGADVIAKWNGKEYEGTLVEPDEEKENEYYIEWNSGEFNWVPKEDVRLKPSENTEGIGSIDDKIPDIVWKVIAAQGASKDYKANGSTDSKGLFIDSENDTAVGVLHFTTSGLNRLYNAMSPIVDKYFPGKTSQDLKSFSKSANGKEIQLGKKKPDEHGWWTEGMIKFLDSSDSKPIQDKAAIQKFKSGFNDWKGNNWVKTERDLAIFIALANSKWSYIRDAGKATGWKPDKMLDWYEKETGGRTRIGIIKRLWPE